MLRKHCTLAVYCLGRGVDNCLHFIFSGSHKHVKRSIYVYFMGSVGVFDALGYPCKGGEVKDVINVSKKFLEKRKVSNAASYELNRIKVKQTGYVLQFTGRKIIQNCNAVFFLRQPLNNMRADKAGATGDDDFLHCFLPVLMSLGSKKSLTL